jgi:hypothetical protein
MNLPEPDCGFLPKSASFCPRTGCTPAAGIEKPQSHLNGGWGFYRYKDSQGEPAALITASTFDEATMNYEQCYARMNTSYHSYMQKSILFQRNLIDESDRSWTTESSRKLQASSKIVQALNGFSTRVSSESWQSRDRSLEIARSRASCSGRQSEIARNPPQASAGIQRL